MTVWQATGRCGAAALLMLLAGVACGSSAQSAYGLADGGGASSGSSGASGGNTSGSSSGAPAASSGAGSGSSGADSSDSGGASSEASSSTDGAGDPAATCAVKKSTASQSGYLGDWSPGDYPPDFASSGNYLTIAGVTGQMGNARQYAVHVPTGYRNDTPVPALFCIHGLGQTASMFCLDTGVAWPTKADHEGFVVIMPNGFQNSWNGGTCCGAAAQNGLDDVALMRAIFAEVGKHVNIDLGRVYATGLSNGAYLSYRLACQASDLFVAIAPSAGAVGTAAIGGGTQATSDLGTCAPTNKVSVLDIHGTSDPLIPYSVQQPSLALFRAASGCSTATGTATVPLGGGDTTCTTFTGCPTCPGVQTTGCTIQGGGHCWFGSSDCGTGGGAIGTAVVGNNSNFMKNTDAVWSFFASLSR
jgi:polyhydroxybutyrate depolymerase